MKVNTKTRYGIRAILELALKKPGNGIYQKDISRNQDISYKYLDQIIAGLKSAGLITSLSGKKSGYMLTREPDKINTYDIYTAFNSSLSVVDCLSNHGICLREESCAARSFWEGLNKVVVEYLKSKTVNDLLTDQVELDKQHQELIYHI